MSIAWIISLASAAYAAVLAGLALFRAPRHPAHISFAVGMLGFSIESIIAGLAEKSGAMTPISRWQDAWIVLSACLAAPWLLFSVCYARGDYRSSLRRWWSTILASLLAPLFIFTAFRDQLFQNHLASPTAGFELRLALPGIILNVLSVISGVLILTNLERTFRGSIGIMRWRIKYMMLGLAVLFVFRLYSETETLLYSRLDPNLQQIESAVLLLACFLMSVALVRNKLFDVDVYPSHAVLYRSLTVILAGLYLIIVGFVAQVIRFFGAKNWLPLQAFLLLGALVALAMVLLSERFRRKLHQFVSRHFRRPSYDYRQAWSTFTAQTGSKVDEPAFCRSVVSWMADTFRVLSVNVWILNDSKDRLRFGGSTSLAETTAAQLEDAGRDLAPLIRAMAARPLPVDIDESKESWVLNLRQLNPGFFPEGGHRVCMPLCVGGDLLGLLILGDRVSGLAFTTEDLDLLKCVGDQAAVGLLRFQLSRRLLGAKEMEAFQTMSTFFVHDLKNTASTLSLMLQNLRDHFGNPDFREDALRAVGRSVQHLQDLIGRLTQLRQELSIQPVDVALETIVQTALVQAGPMPSVKLTTDFQPIPKVKCDPDQFLKVVLNLILNARDAMNGSGNLHLTISAANNWTTLTVNDTGSGMTPEFLRKSLFRPFQTTKKRGLGIGMFQSKMIVDAHGGRVDVESKLGHGTTFRVHLPSN